MPKWRPITIDGVTYRTLKGACEKLEIADHLAYGRIHKGWTIEEALGLKARKARNIPRKIVVEGVAYASLAAACRKYGLDGTLVGYRLNNEWSIEQAFELVARPTKSLDRAQVGHSEKGWIYLITNSVNGKHYVGLSTNTAEDRWRGHVSGSSSDAHPLSLSRAIAEYGEDAFSVQVLEMAVAKDLPALEKKYIKSMRTLAPRGYNLSVGGQLGSYMGILCEVAGVKYPSMSALSRAYQLDLRTVSNRVIAGWTLAAAVGLEKHESNKRVNPIQIAGCDFKSYKDAAKHFNIPYKTVRARAGEGWDLEEIFELRVRPGVARRKRVFSVDGREFNSLKDMAEAYGLTGPEVSSRLGMGWSNEEAVGLKPRERFPNRPQPITLEGVAYKSKTAACKAYGLPYGRVNGRIQDGWSIEEAFELTPREKT